MHLHSELWSPRPSWRKLPHDRRHQLISAVHKHLQSLGEAGISITCAPVPLQSSSIHRSVVFWTLPDDRHLAALAELREATDWTQYFKQMPEDSTVVAQLIASLPLVRQVQQARYRQP